MYNIIMEQIHFEWDENKNKINQSKHGISFEEAKTVFSAVVKMKSFELSQQEKQPKMKPKHITNIQG